MLTGECHLSALWRETQEFSPSFLNPSAVCLPSGSVLEQTQHILMAWMRSWTSNLTGLFCIMFIHVPKLACWWYVQAPESAYKLQS